MNHVCNLLTAVALGAGIAYYMDPVSGRRRRGLLRDRLIHGATKSRKMADARYRDVKNRAQGMYHEVRRGAQDVVEAATASTS